MSLKENLMLVNLSISKWGARKYDPAISNEVTRNHSATADSARVNKLLLSSDSFKNITTTGGVAYNYHIKYTLAWEDNGPRALPSGRYFEYLSVMSEAKLKFEEAVQEFIKEYPELVEKAKYARLGSMYNPNDYPPVYELQDKFKMKFTFMPVADSSDFRIQMSEDEVVQIKNDITAELDARVNKALGDILERSREVVYKIYETLNEPNKIFRDTLLGNVKSLAELIPLLNFTNDAHVNDVCNLLNSLDYDPETLRWKLSLRKEVAAKAKLIYNQI